MQPGRKPTPLAVARVAGNPGKRKLGKDIAVRHIRPDLPKWVSIEGHRFLETVMPELERTDQLTVVDGSSLSAMAEDYIDLVYWRGELAKEKRKRTPVRDDVRRLQRDVRQSDDAFRKWCSEYGLTAVSRTRLAVHGSGDTGNDDEEDLD